MKSTSNVAVTWRWWVRELPALWTWTRTVGWVSAVCRTLTFIGILQAPWGCLQKLEQPSWIKIKVAQLRSTQECFQGLREACGDAELPYRTVARYVKAFLEGRMPFRTTSVQNDPHGPTPCFLLDADRRWTARELGPNRSGHLTSHPKFQIWYFSLFSSVTNIVYHLLYVRETVNRRNLTLTLVVPWLSYWPLDLRFAGSNPAEVDGFFRT